MASVTVVGALKGGVGKTRLAMLAGLYLATVAGQRVAVIDGDTISQTAWDWQRAAQRAERDGGPRWPLTVERHPFEDVSDRIDDLVVEHDHVIADIGGGNRGVLEAALTRADRLLVPVGADSSELAKLPGTWKAAKQAAADHAGAGFEAWVVLSRTDHGTTLPKEAREQLVAAGYPLCDAELRRRVAYQRAYGQVPPRDGYMDVPALLAEVGLAGTGERS